MRQKMRISFTIILFALLTSSVFAGGGSGRTSMGGNVWDPISGGYVTPSIFDMHLKQRMKEHGVRFPDSVTSNVPSSVGTNTAQFGQERKVQGREAIQSMLPGKFEWVYGNNDGGYSLTRGITVDTMGNSYVTGDFTGDTMTIGSMIFKNRGRFHGSSDIFIIKYDSGGHPVWAT